MSKLRKEIQQDTEKYLNNNKYKFKSKSTKYKNHEPEHSKSWKTFDETTIEVLPIDTLDAVSKLKGIYPTDRVGFLVMANAGNQGGGYRRGTSGQEESVCRRTNLPLCFKSMVYPIEEFGSFHIKDLAIIRDTEAKGYTMFKSHVVCDCVLSAAYHSPPIDAEGKMTDGYRQKTKSKIEALLNAFLANGDTCVVLGAYGCGAFGNSPVEMAEIFQQVLTDKKYKDKFKHIIFAILKHAGHKNLESFTNVFN